VRRSSASPVTHDALGTVTFNRHDPWSTPSRRRRTHDDTGRHRGIQRPNGGGLEPP